VRIDDLIKDELRVSELIGKDCTYSTMSDWAKNMHSDTLGNFNEVRYLIKTNLDNNIASLTATETKFMANLEEEKQFLLDNTIASLEELNNTKLNDIRENLKT